MTFVSGMRLMLSAEANDDSTNLAENLEPEPGCMSMSSVSRNQNDTPDVPRRGNRRSIRNQPIYLILMLLAAVGGLSDHVLAGWGIPIFVATISLVAPLFYWRDCYGRASFWAGMALVATVQVPFAIFSRPLIQHDRPFYFLMFLIADPLFALLAITLISQMDPNSPLNARNYSSRQKQPK